jgi:hypothetical protein
MLQCYNSCIILKPTHRHSASDCNAGTSVLHTLLKLGRHRISIIPEEVMWNRSENISNLLFRCVSCFDFDGLISCLAQMYRKKSHWVRQGLSKQPVCISSTPIPSTRKNTCHVTHEQELDKYFGASSCWIGLGVCWIIRRKQVVGYVG